MSYIKIQRKILDWEWYRNLNTCRLFFHVLLKANWKDGRFEGKDIPAGSFVSSVSKLSEETGLTQREVRTAVDHLRSTGELTIKSYNKYSVFTVNNYCQYQDIDKQSDKQLPSKRHSNDKLTTTIEEKKEDKKENINNIVEEIIAHLNAATGAKYRPQTDSTKRAIRARLSEGYTINDFIAVIDKKVAEWKGSDMEKYLRPQTLFGTKFESYLNQPIQNKRQAKKNQFNAFPQRERSQEEMSDLEKRLLRGGITHV